MTENLKKFLEAVSKDTELTAKVGNMGMEELLTLANELGIELTESDLAKPAVQELNDGELDAVGGVDVSCACALGGGGTKDNNDRACACVIAGGGLTDSGRERCVCGFAGYGCDS